MFNDLNFIVRSKNTPNPIMIIPPTWLNPEIISLDIVPTVLLIITPNAENTTENPITKNTVFRMTFVLFIVIVFEPLFWLSSEMVVPEIYAKKAGIIGNMQGATNEPSPANAATAKVTSDTNSNHHFFY